MMTCAVCGRNVLVLDTRTLDSGVCVPCQIRLDNDGRTIEAETAMLAERDRLRAGIGTNDELADYEAARRMIADGD